MLKIKFLRIENVILMQILKQGDEIERGDFDFKASNGIRLCSASYPAIKFMTLTLYLRGKNKNRDKDVASYCYDTSEEAREQLKAYVEAIKEYNNSLQQPAAEDVEDIETVIAE